MNIDRMVLAFAGCVVLAGVILGIYVNPCAGTRAIVIQNLRNSAQTDCNFGGGAPHQKDPFTR